MKFAVLVGTDFILFIKEIHSWEQSGVENWGANDNIKP